MKEIWMISCKHKYGEITAILSNKRSNWLLLGTSRGILMLWDTRFFVCLKILTYPLKCRIWKLASCMRDPTKLIFVAGENEITLFDISTGECLQIWCSLKSHSKEESLETISSQLYSKGFEVLSIDILICR
jgi:phosphoinositide-3-kinase regulatory subunit 4